MKVKIGNAAQSRRPVRYLNQDPHKTVPFVSDEHTITRGDVMVWCACVVGLILAWCAAA